MSQDKPIEDPAITGHDGPCSEKCYRPTNEKILESCWIQDPFGPAGTQKISAVKVLEVLNAQRVEIESLKKQCFEKAVPGLELIAENEGLKNKISSLGKVSAGFQSQRDVYRQELGKVKEVLEYYSDHTRWVATRETQGYSISDSQFISDGEKGFIRAQEALTTLNKLMEG